MDDLAQYSPRRRPWQHGGGHAEQSRWTSPIVFKIVPPVPLARRHGDEHAWRPRLG